MSVPDLYGRQEVLAVLLRPMVTKFSTWNCGMQYFSVCMYICRYFFKRVKLKVRSGRLSVETALQWISLISGRTTGWTGSDLAGLIRSASSFALQRYCCRTYCCLWIHHLLYYVLFVRYFVSRDSNSNLFQLEVPYLPCTDKLESWHFFCMFCVVYFSKIFVGWVYLPGVEWYSRCIVRCVHAVAAQ